MPEKTEQVKLMGQIYSRASFVTVWLGTSDTQDSDLDQIEEYRNNFQVAAAFVLIKRLKSMDLRSNTLSAFNILASEGIQPAWEFTLKLLSHDYFQRSWIIQEIVLASSARVVYGKVEMDWEAFAGGLLELTYGNFATNKLSETRGGSTRSLRPTTTLVNIGQIQNWRRKIQQRKQISFKDVAFGTRLFKATGLRDKVFAMHGFCPNTNGVWTVPNYSLVLLDVYRDATLRLMDEESVTRVLFAAGTGRFSDTTPGLENLPSWVLDWSRTSYEVPLSYLSPKIDYRAGGAAPIHPNAHRQTGASLFLSAFVLDTIVELAPSMNSGVSNPAQQFNQEQAMEDLQQMPRNSYEFIRDSAYVHNPYPYTAPPQQVDELVWRLLIGDRTNTHRPAHADVRDLYEVFLHFLQGPEFAGANDVELLTQKCHEYATFAGRAWFQRRVCITKNGYVGLVPPFTIIGDVVAVVVGAQTPFIVRPVHGGARESRYQLVGECYIHGIMDGETLASVPWTGIIEVV
jgi:hypothetical protein